MNFDGKKVLVTAGANGIGLAIARAFRESGAQVFVTDIDAGAVNDARHGGYTAMESDASSELEVKDLMREVRAQLGGLDILVNNAGIAGPTGPIDSLDTGAWTKTFDVNVHSQFYCVKHGLTMLREANDAVILNMSSAAGRLGMAGRSAYSASKWAVVGFTKTLAIELGPENIRVNAICPGAVDGPRIRKVISDKAAMLGKSTDEIESLYNNQSSMRRMVTPEDIAGIAVFLASNMARNINGQAIAVDGNTEKLY